MSGDGGIKRTGCSTFEISPRGLKVIGEIQEAEMGLNRISRNESRMLRLGVNIDHVATVRQARRTHEPDPVWAAAMAELGGAEQITVHLREDRRHIQDRDIWLLKETVKVKLNLECACEPEMIEIACRLLPDQVCLVPEKREEVTTEGGLNVLENRQRVGECVARLQQHGIFVSLFVDPDMESVEMAATLKADAVELHTGAYANAKTNLDIDRLLADLTASGGRAVELGLHLHAGHGLNYTNVLPVARIPGMEELNIGHSIIARSIFVGIQGAVREMRQLLDSV
jgi:pyridoxine 5-phosphate synthase